ncbi:Keratin, type II cytoskeletal 80, partial [Anas platyrhynchos]
LRQVQCLEQQNKILTTRWNFLKDQDNSHSESDMKAIYDQYMSKMNQEMKALNYEQENLELELTKVLSTMDNFRSKYEDEIRLCSGMEYTFMELKKVSGMGSFSSTWSLHQPARSIRALVPLRFDRVIRSISKSGLLVVTEEPRGSWQKHLGVSLSLCPATPRLPWPDLAWRAPYPRPSETIPLLPGTFPHRMTARDLDASTLHRTELEVKLNGLQELMNLKKTIYEQELEELLTEIKDISVVLGIDNTCKLDLSRIVEEVRAQYEALALRSWEEAETLTRRKLNEGNTQSATYGGHLLDSRREIADLNIQIQKLRSCIVSQKSQCLYLEENIKEAGEHGETALKDAKAKLVKLEEALQKSKEDMAHLVKEYQELMNIKLALDLEILTYRKLVEGEESSMESPIPTVISAVHSRPK